MEINIYTDGSCQVQNPKRPGAASALISINGDISFRKTLSFFNTTNNQMELISSLIALKELERLQLIEEDIIIYSDSQYLVKGMNEYIDKWILKDFAGVKNADIWKKLLPFKKHNIKFTWIKGHKKNKFNEIVDEMARSAMEYIAKIK